jgi:hypothetical protein
LAVDLLLGEAEVGYVEEACIGVGLWVVLHALLWVWWLWLTDFVRGSLQLGS